MPREATPTIAQLRLEIQANIDRCDDDLHLRAGIVISRENGNRNIIRDATKQTDEINWTTAYQQRTLTFLSTALTLLEIFPNSATSDANLCELKQILAEMNNPRLWQTQKRAQANFSKFNKKIYAIVEKGTSPKISEKEFNYANGWISMEQEPYTIETDICHNGKDYKIKSVPYCGLTDDIKKEFRERHQKEWYKSLPKNTQKICDYYVKKIENDELHQLPPSLRGLIPGLKNAYRTSVWHGNEELVHFYHAATLPMGNEDMDEKENIRLAKLNYAAIRPNNETVIYTTLVSRWGDIPRRMTRDIGNKKRALQKKPIHKEELIDRTIATVAKASSAPEEGVHHTNVCLNAARLFEPFALDGFGHILKKIKKDSKGFSDDQFKNDLKNVLIEFGNIKRWNLTKFASVFIDRDAELRVYNFLTSFAALLHKYNKLCPKRKEEQIRWIFSCASGQNRTQILAFMIVLESIYKNVDQPHDATKKEIADLLAVSGHFSLINGPYDYKCGIRSKSASSFSKSIRLFVEPLIIPLADTKRAGDKQYEAVTAEEFLSDLEKANNNIRSINKIWSKLLKRSPSKKVLVDIFNDILNKKNGNDYKGYEGRDHLLQKMIDDADIRERLMSSEKYFHIISFLIIVKNIIENKEMTKREVEKGVLAILDPIPYSSELKELLQIYLNKPEFLNIHKIYAEKGDRNKKIVLQAEITFDQFKENVESSVRSYSVRQIKEEDTIQVKKENNNKIEVVEKGNILFLVEPTQDKAIVNVTVHKHEKDSIHLAVQVMLDAIPKGKPKNIYITVDANDSQAKELIINYSCVILTNRAIPILMENGKALSLAQSRSKLLQIVKEKEVNLRRVNDFEYDLLIDDIYDETIKDICSEREDDIRYLDNLDNIGRLTNNILDICDRLIKITFLNKNLSQKELIEKIIRYKEIFHPEAFITEPEKEKIKSWLQQQFYDYTSNPKKIDENQLTRALVQLLDVRPPIDKSRVAKAKDERGHTPSNKFGFFSENRKTVFNNLESDPRKIARAK